MSNLEDMQLLAFLRGDHNDATLGDMQDLLKLIRNRDLIHVDEVPEWLAAQEQPKDVTRHQQTIEAAGMGGNGFTMAEWAADELRKSALRLKYDNGGW